MTTAFVLAGGGSLGAVEVGMLRALLEHGEQPDFVVGASAGAINCACFAADPTLAGVAKMEATWGALRREHIFPLGMGSLLALMLRRGHLVGSHGLRRLLESHVPYRRLEHAPLPIHVVATELVSGDEVLLSEGPAVDAVLASAAIPGIFPSVSIGGRELVDGGVTNNTPISAAIHLGAQRVVVLPTGFACALKRVPTTIIGKALHSLSLLVARQLVNDIARFRDRCELHVVPPLCPLEFSPYDYAGGAAMIGRATASTRDWIATGGLDAMDAQPSHLVEHHH
jgi:NTE family protein